MVSNELQKEFDQEFAKMKQELGFKSSFEELEKIFFLRDFIQKEGFISTSLSRMMCHRITSTFNSWVSYLHGLVMPNPGSMIGVTESQMFEQDAKQEVIVLLNQIMEIVSRNTLIGLTKNKKQEAQFIDDSVVFWNEKLKPKLTELLSKVNATWKEKSSS